MSRSWPNRKVRPFERTSTVRLRFGLRALGAAWWLGRKDSNLQPSDPESAALPLRHSPTGRPPILTSPLSTPWTQGFHTLYTSCQAGFGGLLRFRLQPTEPRSGDYSRVSRALGVAVIPCGRELMRIDRAGGVPIRRSKPAWSKVLALWRLIAHPTPNTRSLNRRSESGFQYAVRMRSKVGGRKS